MLSINVSPKFYKIIVKHWCTSIMIQRQIKLYQVLHLTTWPVAVTQQALCQTRLSLLNNYDGVLTYGWSNAESIGSR